MPKEITERTRLWKRVGTFVRTRRDELGLSQGQIIQALGYASRNAVSNIEVGIEGLPAKRAYAWADVLEVPRDAFFQFVTGQTERMQKTTTSMQSTKQLKSTEEELLARYRRLPPKYQRRLCDQALEFETLARTARPKR